MTDETLHTETAGSNGPPLPPAEARPTKFCFACAAQIDARAEICPKCGVRQPAMAGMVNAVDAAFGRSRLVASLLAIFVGTLGIHRFYLGQQRQGTYFIIAVFATLGVGAIVTFIIGLIEGVQLLSMTDTEFQRRYPPTAE